MKKVSIIIPIYNVSPYLARSLDSALAQTLDDVEIIAVDDGSTDGSSDILRDYERRYSQIKGVYQENGGLSAARNSGLNVASGEYVAFLDSDDWFEPSACEAALRRAEETGAEVTRFFTRLVWEGSEPVEPPDRAEQNGDVFGGMEEFVATDPVDRLKACFDVGGPNVWSKLWRRDFLERNGLRFRAGLLWEDVDFTARAAIAAKKVATLRQVLHNYFQRSTSIIGKNAGTAAHAEGLTDSLDGALDAALGTTAEPEPRTIDWLHETRLKMLYGDFSSSNDREALEIVVRALRDGDWKRVFDPRFELDSKIRYFFATLYDRFFSDEPKKKLRFPPLRKKGRRARREYFKRIGFDRSNDFVERGKKAIEASRVVSFDVFDTLLVRPFVKPTDFFHYMEARENVPGFADARIEAERTARRRGRFEVTLDEIYRELKPEYAPLAEREIELERRTLTANPDVLELYRRAISLGKPVFIISDMYLSSDAIRSFLEKNGIVGFRKIYVSSEYRRAKSDGELFDVVLAENGVAASDWLHVGDNPRSDVDVPKSKGMNALRVVKTIDAYFDRFPTEKKFYEKEPKRLETSIVLAAAARRQIEEEKVYPNGNYWRRLGYRVGGPAILAYLQFVEKVVRENALDELMFVARDGWILKDAYRTLLGDANVALKYVYASRRIGADFARGKKTQKDETRAENRTRRDVLTKYLERETAPRARKIGVVDTLTSGFSAQKTVCDGLPEKEIRGVYWTVAATERFDSLRFDALLPFDEKNPERARTRNWELMEFLMTSPEPPVDYLSADAAPIYMKPNPCELWRSRLYRDVARGELDFIRDFVDFFGDDAPVFSGENAVETVDDYLEKTSRFERDRRTLLWCASDSAHRTYAPLDLLFSDYDVDFGRRTEAKSIGELNERVKSRFFWRVATKPFSFRIRSRGVAASIFPRLNRTIFSWTWRLTSKFSLAFQIGSRKEIR